eukprot:COSAG01_NODE_771_length_13718_cov_54.441442_3_plen_207_part_00
MLRPHGWLCLLTVQQARQLSADRLMELPDFHRVIITPTLTKPHDTAHRDAREVACHLARALELRQKWRFQRETPEWEDERLAALNEAARVRPFEDAAGFMPAPGAADISCSFGADGIASLTCNKGGVLTALPWAPPSLAEFTEDLRWLHDTVCVGKSETTFAVKRLTMLEKNFNFYSEMNWSCVLRHAGWQDPFAARSRYTRASAW